MGIPILTAESRAAVGTEFLSPYPWGFPYSRQSPGLLWGRNFCPHTHGDSHTHGRVQGCCGDGISIPIPMGIPIPAAESRAAVGTEFLSPYPWGFPYPRQTCELLMSSHFLPLSSFSLSSSLPHSISRSVSPPFRSLSPTFPLVAVHIHFNFSSPWVAR